MSFLPSVADHLSKAARNAGGGEADAFGRSAFNRYYYAAFLSTRELLATIERSWKGVPHSNIPDLLENDLRTRFQREMKRLQDKHLISEGKAACSWRDTTANQGLQESHSRVRASACSGKDCRGRQTQDPGALGLFKLHRRSVKDSTFTICHGRSIGLLA
jgi:hypothetical protein